MNCWRCNAELSDEMLTCPECGSTQRVRTRRVRCRHCGRRSPCHLRVCPFCGRDLTKAWPRRLAWVVGATALIVVLALLAVRYVHLDIGRWRGSAASRLQLAADWLAQAPAIVLPTVILPPSPTVTATPTATPTPTGTPPPTNTPSSTHTPTVLPSPNTTPEYGSYRVRSGDTPASIALRFDVGVDELMQVNDISDPGSLQVDQELIIPLPVPTLAPDTPTPTESASSGTPETLETPKPDTPASTVVPTAIAVSAPDFTPTPSAVAIAASGERLYTVAAGDTLSQIAQEFDVSVATLMSANGITDPLQLRVSQELVVPLQLSEDTATPAAAIATAPTAEGEQARTSVDLRPGPVLLSPEDGTPYSGGDATIELRWTSETSLGPGEEFVVHIGYLEADGTVIWLLDQPQEQPLRDSSWFVPTGLFGLAPQESGRTHVWYVQVERVVRDERGELSGEREAVSAPSEQYRFSWK